MSDFRLSPMYRIRLTNLKALAEKYPSINDFAKACGKKPQSISDILNERKQIGERFCSDVENALNLLPGVLSFPQKEIEAIPTALMSVNRIPLISCVSAGLLNFADETSGEWIPVAGDVPKDAYALNVHGDSMTPIFDDGDVIVLDPNKSPRPGSYVVARSTAGIIPECTFKQYVLKGYLPNGSEHFELKPLNPNYPVLDSVQYQLEIIGVLIEHRKTY